MLLLFIDEPAPIENWDLIFKQKKKKLKRINWKYSSASLYSIIRGGIRKRGAETISLQSIFYEFYMNLPLILRVLKLFQIIFQVALTVS